MYALSTYILPLVWSICALSTHLPDVARPKVLAVHEHPVAEER
jgi:hypothetical protein